MTTNTGTENSQRQSANSISSTFSILNFGLFIAKYEKYVLNMNH